MKKIIEAIKEDNIENLKNLIKEKQYIEKLYTASASASDFILNEIVKSEKKEKVLSFFLTKQFIKPDVYNQKFFTLCCEKGYINYIKEFIKTGKIKIDFEFNIALRKAVSNNQIEVVKYLLTFEEVNPRSKNDEAIRIAAKKNYIEIINILLEKDLNIVSKNNSFIRSLIKNNQLELVKTVFNNNNYNSKSTFIAAWEEAASQRNEEIMNYLMKRKDYSIVSKSHDLTKKLIKENNLKYFKVLVNEMTEEDKNKVLYYALKQSCMFDNLDIFKYIVEEQNIMPFTGRGKLLFITLEQKNLKMFKEVYKYKNKNLDKNLYYIMRSAILNERLEELNILIKEKNGTKISSDLLNKLGDQVSEKVKVVLKFNNF